MNRLRLALFGMLASLPLAACAPMHKRAPVETLIPKQCIVKIEQGEDVECKIVMENGKRRIVCSGFNITYTPHCEVLNIVPAPK